MIIVDIWAVVHCKLRYSFEGVSHAFFLGQNILVNYLLIEKDILRDHECILLTNTGESNTNSRPFFRIAGGYPDQGESFPLMSRIMI